MSAIRFLVTAIAFVLMMAGFILMKRSRSPYAGATMDADALATHRRGEILSLAGNVAFLVFLVLSR